MQEIQAEDFLDQAELCTCCSACWVFLQPMQCSLGLAETVISLYGLHASTGWHCTASIWRHNPLPLLTPLRPQSDVKAQRCFLRYLLYAIHQACRCTADVRLDHLRPAHCHTGLPSVWPSCEMGVHLTSSTSSPAVGCCNGSSGTAATCLQRCQMAACFKGTELCCTQTSRML